MTVLQIDLIGHLKLVLRNEYYNESNNCLITIN